jgi:hypothetical protein
MKVLVLGASGATGKLAVMQLIKRQINTRIIVRKSAVLPEAILNNPLVEIVKRSISEINDSDMNNLIQDCNIIISCLGHNISFKGMFGKPRYLVTDAVKRITGAVKKNTDKKVKLILMSTTAYTNTVFGEKNSIGEKIILFMLKLLLPPHRDNMNAANYLIKNITKEDKNIEWITVRPDTLVNEEVESSYELCDSPVRSPIFDAGKTSRINVGHFMAELVTDEKIWKKWQFKTPVLYNK